mgnify:CR=1 FL=1
MIKSKEFILIKEYAHRNPTDLKLPQTVSPNSANNNRQQQIPLQHPQQLPTLHQITQNKIPHQRQVLLHQDLHPNHHRIDRRALSIAFKPEPMRHYSGALNRGIAKEVPENRQYLFYSAYLLCMTGLLGMTITGDVFNIFVFLEISSLASYTLISQGTSRRALTSAIQYLVMGTIGGTFVLLGIGLVYQLTGSLNMVQSCLYLFVLILN